MPNQETNNASYQQGFNEGYLITELLPKLAESLKQIKSDSPRMEGFRDGREEFLLEKTKEHVPQWLKKDLNKIEPQPNLSKDKIDKNKGLDKE